MSKPERTKPKRSAIEYVVFAIFLLFGGLLWAVIGTVFWIAMFSRFLGVFMFGVLTSMFSGQEPPGIQQRLSEITTFLVRGFKAIHRAIYEPGPARILRPDFNLLLVETAWTTLFWLPFIFLAFGKSVAISTISFLTIAVISAVAGFIFATHQLQQDSKKPAESAKARGKSKSSDEGKEPAPDDD